MDSQVREPWRALLFISSAWLNASGALSKASPPFVASNVISAKAEMAVRTNA